MPDQTSEEKIEVESIRVRADDGDPVLDIPCVPNIRLNVHVIEWTHDRPENGEPVEMDLEVESDDFAWWFLYPERGDLAFNTRHQDFPTVEIVPEFEE